MYPTEIIDRYKELIEDAIPGVVTDEYAGELLTEDGIKEFAVAVRAKDYCLVDIINIVSDEGGQSADGRTPKDRIVVIVYAAVSNARSKVEGSRSSVELAQRARKALVGKKVVPSNPNEFTESIIQFSSIERELVIKGLSVHALVTELVASVDLDAN